jgi:Domain of unknown function (DUF3943)
MAVLASLLVNRSSVKLSCMVALPVRTIAVVTMGFLAGEAVGHPMGQPLAERDPAQRYLVDDCLVPDSGTFPGGTIVDADCGTPPPPDQRGRRSDTAHFLAYQFAAIAILYALPESATGWTDERKENYSLKQWWENVQEPHMDSDDFFLNYVTHPYWGAAYFVRSRERGYGPMASFWYSATLSAIYEFGAEALFEEPSLQDLIATPVGGWLVGSYFMHVREGIYAGHADGSEMPFKHRFVLVVTDPLGAINRTVDDWFGLDERFNIHPMIYDRPVAQRLGGDGSGSTERVYGIGFTVVW